MTQDSLTYIVTLIVACSLAVIAVSMSIVMLVGLFDRTVDNQQIFEVLTPAFQTIVGGFIGVLSGIRIGRGNKEQE